MMRLTIVTGLALTLTCGTAFGSSDFFKQFKENYSLVDFNLDGSDGEVAQITNFVYKKDVATFTFSEGKMYLLRYINGRPTTALFVGKGHAHIEIPSETEKLALLACTKKDVIDEDFETVIIRMADDLDLLLKEKFTFTETELGWRPYNLATKKAQGEIFFQPVIQNQCDKYFLLLRSVYERKADGFFWIDFNRYVYNFDPNRPEQVRISYEYEGGDFIATETALFQRQERNVYDNSDMSNISYPTINLEKSAVLEMGGLDGRTVKNGKGNIKLQINADSLRFISVWLHFNLKTDSVWYNGQLTDYWRRGDFDYIGVILPEYRYQGDSIDLTFFYHGNDFDCALPYVENPNNVPHRIEFIIPKGYNYIATDRSPVEKLDKKREKFSVTTSGLFNKYYFQGYASGYDTISLTSDMGLSLNFLKSKHLKKSMRCFIPDKMYQNTTLGAFNFFSSRFGGPPGTFVEYIYPEGILLSMPGMMKIPQVACVTEGSWQAVGGFHNLAGYSVARQWFGSLVRPISGREAWLEKAVPQYMAMMFIQNDYEGGEFYSNLYNKRDSVTLFVDRGRDLPLAAGKRISEKINTDTIHANKGPWLLHMLRFLMFDVETQSDASFVKFLQELTFTCNNKPYSNADIVALAEKHYGQSLGWFFDQWLYGIGYPTYNVEYKIEQRGEEHFVAVNVKTSGVSPDFEMPVIVRVTGPENSSFYREAIKGPSYKFELGPFKQKPKEFHFNEFLSVLCKDKVKKL